MDFYANKWIFVILSQIYENKIAKLFGWIENSVSFSVIFSMTPIGLWSFYLIQTLVYVSSHDEPNSSLLHSASSASFSHPTSMKHCSEVQQSGNASEDQ